MMQLGRRQFLGLQRQTAAWWSVRTHRERKLVRAAACITALGLTWIGLQPALDTITQARQELPRLHANAAQVDAYIIEAKALQHRQSGRLDPARLDEALEASLRRAGLTAFTTTLKIRETQDDSDHQWALSFTVADAERVMGWLAGLPYLLQLQADDVALSRANVDGRDRPGYVTGRVLLRLPSSRTP